MRTMQTKRRIAEKRGMIAAAGRLKYAVGLPVLLALTAALLSGCGELMVLDPKGPIGASQKELIYITAALCAVVLVPVLLLTAFVVIRYRDRRENKAAYAPNWAHNRKLEVLWWSIPIVIIGILAVITVKYTHELEPSKPIAAEEDTLVIQVLSLDWKWLFLYPEQDIATVNHLTIPEDVPIRFELTADAPMNSFWIPQLGGQIYAMSGMAMALHLQADEPGVYYGSGANFTGEHFAEMTFKAAAVTQKEFEEWVENVKSAAPGPLTRETYAALAQPGTADEQMFAGIPDGLFYDIVNKYVVKGDRPVTGPHNPNGHSHGTSAKDGGASAEHDAHDIHGDTAEHNAHDSHGDADAPSAHAAHAH